LDHRKLDYSLNGDFHSPAEKRRKRISNDIQIDTHG